MLRHSVIPVAATLLLLSASVSAQPVFSDPLDITNPFHPFPPMGTSLSKTLVSQQGHTDEVAVHNYLPGTRLFEWPLNSAQMVACRILEEVAIEDEEVVEISQNFFAQADDGTVYYFGETVDIFENGMLVSNEGSWLVGGPTLPTDPITTFPAADPAEFMPASIQVGQTWKPEDLLPLFPLDETVEAIKLDKTVVTPAGRFTGCLKVLESTELNDETENKWYAPGVGVIKEKGKGEILILESLEIL
jgi:hypothetical protein